MIIWKPVSSFKGDCGAALKIITRVREWILRGMELVESPTTTVADIIYFLNYSNIFVYHCFTSNYTFMVWKWWLMLIYKVIFVFFTVCWLLSSSCWRSQCPGGEWYSSQQILLFTPTFGNVSMCVLKKYFGVRLLKTLIYYLEKFCKYVCRPHSHYQTVSAQVLVWFGRNSK